MLYMTLAMKISITTIQDSYMIKSANDPTSNG